MLKTCLICPTIFKVRPSLVKKGYGLYCSRSCYKNSPSFLALMQRAKNMGYKNRGRKLAIEQRQHIAEGHKGLSSGMKGKIPWNKGIPHTQETKDKISKMHKSKKRPNLQGNKNGAWQGGITSLDKAIRTCLEYSLWRTAIFKKDNYTCVKCGIRNGLGKEISLEADHYPLSFAQLLQLYNIKTLKEALLCQEFWNIENGRTLCQPCHKQTATYLMPLAKHPLINPISL